jgi:hypothetical protein
LCSKPGCQRAAAAVLSYDYASRTATLVDPIPGRIDPHLYVLCAGCADKLTPPRGWELMDDREEPPLFLPRDPAAATLEVHEIAGEGSVPEPVPAPDRSRQLFFGHSA